MDLPSIFKIWETLTLLGDDLSPEMRKAKEHLEQSLSKVLLGLQFNVNPPIN